ncbi:MULTISPECIES: OmpH family outer membrane protein [Cobetia]|uniref:OmpH family outer membrane protein n=1 Tax=Cobetia crustatorum TaxID=553385 RepID=A0A558HGW5_9GAMM|nr:MULTISPECIES: OmpH family outer membrane protein [Cobetia]TVU68351.1 OmpH family outer membrane protein [Cobetia crustatorum]
MRKLTRALCLAGGLAAFATPMLAQASDVAVIDWRQALLSSDTAKRSMNQLKNQLAGKQDQAKALAKELESLQAKLQKDGAVMSDSERQSVQQQLRQKGGQFQQLRGQVQQQQQQAEQAFLKQSKPKLDQAIQKVVDKHGVELVVDRNATVYSKDGLDLTDEVTQVFNSLN